MCFDLWKWWSLKNLHHNFHNWAFLYGERVVFLNSKLWAEFASPFPKICNLSVHFLIVKCTVITNWRSKLLSVSDNKNRKSTFSACIFTARNEVGARLCFYRCVWFCSQEGGVPDQVHPPWDQVHPPGPGTPPGPSTPPRTRFPQTRYTPGTRSPQTRYTPRTRSPQNQVHPLGPFTPPRTRYPPGTRYTPWTRYTPQDQVCPQTRYRPPGPGRYGLRAGGTHPTGMQSCSPKFSNFLTFFNTNLQEFFEIYFAAAILIKCAKDVFIESSSLAVRKHSLVNVEEFTPGQLSTRTIFL